tara:strand:+ start:402 stop:632 length:231 start_codon:yes stop_codon:yes gene_type:complete
MDSGLYTVAVKSNNLIHIIDAKRGVTINRTTIQGEIINGPIVVGDRFTVVAKQKNGATMGFIYKLPTGIIIDRFNV